MQVSAPQPPPLAPHRFPRALRLTLQFFANHGVFEGLRLLAVRAVAPRRRPSTLLLATPLDLYPRHTPLAIHPFDLAYNVETSGFRHGQDLGRHLAPHITSTPATLPPPAFASMLWNTAYYGIAPSIFERALALLGTPADPASPQAITPPIWSRFSFVDLGCGKGRALLLASRYPFRHILGVELDGSLAAIADTNLRTFHAPWQQCRSLAVQHADATTADLPGTPVLLYLYHPFLAPVLKRVLRRLERSLRQQPRELWLVYINPQAAGVLRRFPFLRETARATLTIDPEDALPDRLGSSREEVAIFHFLPPA